MIIKQVGDQFEGKLYIHHLERKTIDGKIKFRHLTGGLLLKVND